MDFEQKEVGCHVGGLEQGGGGESIGFAIAWIWEWKKVTIEDDSGFMD
jgi:hypothetical protein